MTSDALNTPPIVAVLLATNNPSNYVVEQIESIKKQEKVHVRLYWGDYASPQETKNLVRELLEGFDFREFDINLPGPAENFFFLLKQTDEKYIAFSDQDDIWLPSKLYNQVKLLELYDEKPVLVHSTSEILFQGERIKRNAKCQDHTISTLAVSNCCQGCTIMINKLAKDTVLSSLPSGLVWHDWWIGLVISLKGLIIYSDETEVLYRIHGSNTIGVPSFTKKLWNFLANDSSPVSYQITQALDRFGPSDSASDPIFMNIRSICSAKFSTRFFANMTDMRRRISIKEDILRRVSWTLRQP
jgi:rhamnosyltransferase